MSRICCFWFPLNCRSGLETRGKYLAQQKHSAGDASCIRFDWNSFANGIEDHPKWSDELHFIAGCAARLAVNLWSQITRFCIIRYWRLLGEVKFLGTRACHCLGSDNFMKPHSLLAATFTFHFSCNTWFRKAQSKTPSKARVVRLVPINEVADNAMTTQWSMMCGFLKPFESVKIYATAISFVFEVIKIDLHWSQWRTQHSHESKQNTRRLSNSTFFSSRQSDFMMNCYW